ncbi:MAG: sulfurtransferase, partial [Alphaproteobacteria bacterium]|nr:sulfurtransferase [Alphaproteobacteria bacterium]
MFYSIISAHDLSAQLSTKNCAVLDATYGIPNYPEAALTNMTNGRIAGAQFFDIDDIADPTAPYAHTLPTPDVFAAKVGGLGIGNDDTVFIYDQNGLSFAAARAWWMFRAMGHDKVAVLDGGLPAWRAAGLPLETGPLQQPTAKTFIAHYRPALYRSFEQIEDGGDTVLDARAAPRFDAVVHTMDGDRVPAHIEGSYNTPFQNLLDASGAMFSSKEKLREQLGAYLDKPSLVCS